MKVVEGALSERLFEDFIQLCFLQVHQVTNTIAPSIVQCVVSNKADDI